MRRPLHIPRKFIKRTRAFQVDGSRMPSLDERILILPITNELIARLIIIRCVVILGPEAAALVKNPAILKILHKLPPLHS